MEMPPPLPPPEPLPEPPADVAYVIVNEAGASDYSASTAGREEFPSRDASLRHCEHWPAVTGSVE